MLFLGVESKNISVVNISHVEVSKVQKALELFSGLGSLRNVFIQQGFDVVSLDWDQQILPKFKKIFCIGSIGRISNLVILTLCSHQSRLSITAWYVRDHQETSPMPIDWSEKIEIIRFFKPANCFIENPRFGLLSKQYFMKQFSFIDVPYCCFEDYG